MKKYFISIMAFLVILTCSISRADSNWAADVEDFVDRKIPYLTRSYAEKDLKKRWLDAFVSPLTRISIIQEDIVRRVNINNNYSQTEERMELTTAIEMLKNLQLNMAVLWIDMARLNDVSNELNNLNYSCNNDSIVGSRAIASVGSLAIGNVSLPGNPYYFLLWDPTFVSTILSVIYDIIIWDDDKKKRDRAEKALKRLPTKIFSPSEAFELSRKICKEIHSEHTKNIDEYLLGIQQFKQSLVAQEASYWETYKEIETYLSSASFIEVLNRAGIWQEEVQQSQDIASAEMLIDLELANNELNKLRVAATNSNSCRKGIVSIETYEDALVELHVQLKEYIKLKQLPEVTNRMNQLQNDVSDQLDKLQNLYAITKDRAC